MTFKVFFKTDILNDLVMSQNFPSALFIILHLSVLRLLLQLINVPLLLQMLHFCYKIPHKQPLISVSSVTNAHFLFLMYNIFHN